MPEDNKPAAAPAKPQAEAPQHKTRDTVWVICKLPHGLTIYPEIERDTEALDAAGNRRKVWVEDPKQRITLKGANAATVIGRNGRLLGYGMTEVDRSVWERWFSMHKDFPAVANKMIMVQETRDRAMSAAMEHKSLMTGFEQIEPNAPTDQPGVVSTDEAYAKAAGMGAGSIQR